LKNNRGQKLYVFLFDQILLFTRLATRNGLKSYQLTNYPIPIEFLRIEDIEDGVKIPELSSGSFSRTLAGSKPGFLVIYEFENESNISHVLDFFVKPLVTAGCLKNRRLKPVFRFVPELRMGWAGP